jgi:hypothetical protein
MRFRRITRLPSSNQSLARSRSGKRTKNEVDKLLARHKLLVHSERKRIISHVQRKTPNWIINTVMLEGYSVPFRFKRNKPYKNLKDMFVNLTYYADTEAVAGIDVEVMNVVRIRTS